MKSVKNIGLVVLGLGTLVLAACAPRLMRYANRSLSGKGKKRTGSKSGGTNTPGQVNKSGAHKHHGNRRSHAKK